MLVNNRLRKSSTGGLSLFKKKKKNKDKTKAKKKQNKNAIKLQMGWS